jgi:hypothetical protein
MIQRYVASGARLDDSRNTAESCEIAKEEGGTLFGFAVARIELKIHGESRG